MNTGFLGPAVATVLTVYGIETNRLADLTHSTLLLQQYLPFTVLKHIRIELTADHPNISCNSTYRLRY